jgi:hypothetical protein
MSTCAAASLTLRRSKNGDSCHVWLDSAALSTFYAFARSFGSRGVQKTIPASTANEQLATTLRPRVRVQTVGLNAETRKVSAPSQRREMSIDTPFYGTCLVCGDQPLVWGILPGEKFQTIPTLYQCGLNVFPVSSSVFRRERIRGHPSAQES